MKPIKTVWDRGNRGFEDQCEMVVNEGYILYSMSHHPAYGEEDTSYWQAIFVSPDLKTYDMKLKNIQ